MAKEDNIHIKIELLKDEISGELKIITCFDPNAPNFCKDEDGYFWCPTIEERDFLNEAFEFIPAQNQIKSHPLEKKEERFVAPTPMESKPQVNADRGPEIKPPEMSEEKVMFEPQAPVSKEHIKPWEKASPMEKNDWKKPADQPPLEKKEREIVFEVTGEELITEEHKSKDQKEVDEGIIVKADDGAIERALKKDNDEDGTIKEVDEQTIIEKVLSQKKKGSKWIRNR